MLVIRNQQLEKEMVSKDLLNAKIRESINREYTLSFSIMHDYEKTQYIKPFNIAEIEDDYFDISYFKESHNEDGSKTIGVECEHVSYRLNDEQYDLEYFASYGTAQQILSQILANTPFTVGTVDVTGSYHFSIQEEMSRRAILVLFAEEIGAELKFNKFTISLYQKRGKDEGQQFRIGKNVRGVTREIDTREMIDGQPKTAYEINLVELSFAQGYANLENIELGDTWKVIDEEINLVTTQRIVAYEYDPINKVNSRAEIANFIDDLGDELYEIRRLVVAKDRLYNGIRIGPEHGFEAIRSDNRARTVMNATEGIKIQRGDGSGSNWVDVIFLDTEGNARFTGRIDASEFIGGLINIGNGNFTVDNNGNVVIKQGSIDLGNGNFTVDNNGNVFIKVGSINLGDGNFVVNNNGDVTIKKGAITWSGVNKPTKNDLGQWTTHIDEQGIYTGKIVANQIEVEKLSAISADLGEVTAGKITADTTINVGTDLTVGRNVTLTGSGNRTITFRTGAQIMSGFGIAGLTFIADELFMNNSVVRFNNQVYMDGERVATRNWVLQQIQQALNN